MMGTHRLIPPTGCYGVTFRDNCISELDEVVEQVRRTGYAVFDAGYSMNELRLLTDAFKQIRAGYIRQYGEARLRSINEFNTVRALLSHGSPAFIGLATHKNLMNILSKLIHNSFMLNQQNGLINPPGEVYEQGSWHRDLTYQHYVSSHPLAISALFCMDDFNVENGCTWVLPGTHKEVNYPSESWIQHNAVPVECRKGTFILMDSMLFHAGGFNRSNMERLAINNFYTIMYFKQLINLPKMLKHTTLSPDQKKLFGFSKKEFSSVDSYLNSRPGD